MSNDFEGIPLEKEGRRLVWNDEFNGNTLDGKKWSNERLMGNNALIYDNSEKHLCIEDGMLHLKVQRAGDTYSLPESVTTKYTMLFKYGYLEMRAKVPYRNGAWPSFWLKGDTPYLRIEEGRNNWFPETDIFEVFSADSYLVSNLHKWGNVNGKAVHEQLSTYDNGAKHSYDFTDIDKLNDEFHIYGMLWDEHSIKFSVDGVYYFEANIDSDSIWKTEDYQYHKNRSLSQSSVFLGNVR